MYRRRTSSFIRKRMMDFFWESERLSLSASLSSGILLLI